MYSMTEFWKWIPTCSKKIISIFTISIYNLYVRSLKETQSLRRNNAAKERGGAQTPRVSRRLVNGPIDPINFLYIFCRSSCYFLKCSLMMNQMGDRNVRKMYWQCTNLFFTFWKDRNIAPSIMKHINTVDNLFLS